jgi:hypothetical protein
MTPLFFPVLFGETMTVSRAIGVLCVMLAIVQGVYGADEPAADLNDSPAAKQAKLKFDLDVQTARQNYERKVELLRKEMERNLDASRTAYASSLKAAEAEATKADKLDLAIVFKNVIEQVSAPLSLHWPEILPDDEVSDGAGVKPFDQTFKFDDDRGMSKFWNFSPKTQFSDGGLHLDGPGARIESKYGFKGDFDVLAEVESSDGTSSQMWINGEKVFEGGDRGGMMTLRAIRKGNFLKVSFRDGHGNEGRSTIKVKESEIDKSFPVLIQAVGDGSLQIRGVSIKASESELLE